MILICPLLWVISDFRGSQRLQESHIFANHYLYFRFMWPCLALLVSFLCILSNCESFVGPHPACIADHWRLQGQHWTQNDEALGALVCPSHGKNLLVPYVNQRWDTSDDFSGDWACGPACAVMALAFFNRIAPHPINCTRPSPHISQFGWYLSNAFESTSRHRFDRVQPDSNGRPAVGAYGACTDSGGASAWRIRDFLAKHQLLVDLYPILTLDHIWNAIRKGHLVLLSTRLSSHTHFILVRGYTRNGQLIVNDPWGNATSSHRYSNGNGVVYDWEHLNTRYGLLIKPNTMY